MIQDIIIITCPYSKCVSTLPLSSIFQQKLELSSSKDQNSNVRNCINIFSKYQRLIDLSFLHVFCDTFSRAYYKIWTKRNQTPQIYLHIYIYIHMYIIASISLINQSINQYLFPFPTKYNTSLVYIRYKIET